MMREKLPITIIIAAKNEEKNLEKSLPTLFRAERLILVDSQSSDDTASLVKRYDCETLQFEYRGGYPKKRQWALDSLDIRTPWVMLLDADERVSYELWSEIEAAINDYENVAFAITKGFHFMGRRFRFGGFSHSAVLLFRKGKARFEHITDDPSDAPDMEIHERLIVDGKVRQLNVPLIHEDYKGLESYIKKHRAYADWEARARKCFLEKKTWGAESVQPRLFGNIQEKRRFLKSLAVRMPFEPAMWFFYHYVLRLGFLEGRPGLVASKLRAAYIQDVRRRMKGTGKAAG